MKKNKILSGLLTVVMLLSLITTNVFATEDQNVVLSDVPFDYMTNLNTRVSNSYEQLDVSDKKMVYTIPAGISKNLTTEAFLETILNNEYLMDLFAYDKFVQGVKSREDQFRIVEFLNRSDSIAVLDLSYLKYSNLLKEVEEKTGFTIDKVTKNVEEQKLPKEFVTNYIKVSFLIKLKENYSNILCGESALRAISTGYVYTKGGKAIDCYFNRDWSNSGTSESEMNFYKNIYKVRYAATYKEDVSPRYNCHSYAWYSNNTVTNNVWIETQSSLQTYLSETTSGTQSPQIGITKVIYYDNLDGVTGNEVSHSSKVYSVNSNGVVSVISKWGNNAVFIHTIEGCPYYYSTKPVAYRNY